MVEFIKSAKGKVLYWIIWISAGVIFVLFNIPALFDVVFNRVEPFIMGMPYIVFMQLTFWIILWLLMVALYWVQNIRGEL